MSKNIPRGLKDIQAQAMDTVPVAKSKKRTTVTLEFPEETIKSLKKGVFERDLTMRALVLEALAAKGYTVPAGEIVDLRKA